ncbi:MAG: DUF4388 domain-containing protein [Planctomycetes bacterium]|nr:DUF4388 domain-containing protein [Planctomycetota bacterium]
MATIRPISANSTEAKVVDLSTRILETVKSMIGGDRNESEADFGHLLDRVKDLFGRRHTLTAPGGETKDMLTEVLFGRVIRGFTEFYENADISGDPRKAAEFLLGTVLTGSALAEFAHVIDRVLMEEGAPKDYHLAGRADFISMDELLQLLASGKHTGQLSLQNPEARLDIWFKNGLIAFIDPHCLRQRLIQGRGLNRWREIPPDLLLEANEIRGTNGTPVLLTLHERGFLKSDELRDQLRNLGFEQIYAYLQDGKHCAFGYTAMETLPAFVEEHHCGMPVTPLLLEGHKRIDDWRRIQRVFPDLDAPIEPTPDMYMKIGQLSLDVVEIKALTLVDGMNSFRDVASQTGLNNFDLGMMFCGFARDGVIVPPGGTDALFDDEELSLEESMDAAALALDANEALDAIPDSLDQVFGTDDDGFGLGYTKAARKDDA